MKPLILASVALPLIGIACFYFFSHTTNREVSTKSVVSQIAKRSLPAVQMNEKSNKEHEREKQHEEYSKSSDARNAERHAAVAKSVENIDLTSSGYEALDRRMKQREPQYRELLEKENLEESKIKEVLNIIREREKNQLDEVIRRMHETSSEVGDYRDKERVKASQQKALGKWESAQIVSEMHLLPILGPDRYKQLLELEARMKAAGKTQKD